MANPPVPAAQGAVEPAGNFGAGVAADFVTMTVADQLFGIPVLTVQDVLGPQRITRIPLAPAEVAGALNLRGRIVTAIDVRRRLGLAKRDAEKAGQVLSLSAGSFERNPGPLDPRWREVSAGIYRLKGKLLVVLEVARLLDFKPKRGSEAA